ncbi:phospholipid metabolism-related protein, putative [Cryptococcus deneoformans JEC21]|uniref:Phospholipid metabolism-related protein, putative n=1 Tax=Cryptococcus deneoformans (strain JEC21 / ATCC MYA-565) TaxID=214684 RepID=Q5K6U5_CRYD1|nr:phospholipid metabolism-related protein, putative [Cryptococcus neoformans var. neoformans JEC21]AAW47193.2 phospholipid metabolism-related protein, putative [Cryptococcus neoformans var. neoformans JEC21]
MALSNPWAKQADRPITTPPAGSRRRRIFISYAPDWVITILLWGLFYLLDKINGYRRLFSVTDTSLAHPYADPERVPVWLLAVLCGIVPAVFIILVAAFVRRSFWDGHNGILGLILGLGLTATFTNIIKITVGRPRPDLFARCILPPDLTSNPVHGLTSWTACTTTDDGRLSEGFRSFPSGHSSFAWCGMWYLILYLAAKMEINNRQGFTYKSWLLLAPLSCATLVAVSRTMDYRHHATDVIAGSVIGLLGGWYAYRQYYPPLSHPVAYKPYSPRIPKSDPPPIPLHSHSHSRPSTEAMLRQHEFQPSQAQFQFGRESSASPVETLGERRAGGGYGPDGPVGIVDMNGWNRQPYQPQQTQQTPTTIKDLEIQSDRQPPQSNNNHLQESTLADPGGENVEMVERPS